MFSNTADYDPEELTAYELGCKTQFLDNTLQINSSFYLSDYTSIHTVATKVTSLGGTSTSVLDAPGAEVMGTEAQILWLPNDNLSFGGNFSYTPNEYTKTLMILDPASVAIPTSLYPDRKTDRKNIKGNQLLQMPELKYTALGRYSVPLDDCANLVLPTLYSWTDDVYHSSFENQTEMARAYGLLDMRATWTNGEQSLEVAAFCDSILEDFAVLQLLRNGEGEHFRQTGATTLPRLFGLELTYRMGAY